MGWHRGLIVARYKPVGYTPSCIPPYAFICMHAMLPLYMACCLMHDIPAHTQFPHDMPLTCMPLHVCPLTNDVSSWTSLAGFAILGTLCCDKAMCHGPRHPHLEAQVYFALASYPIPSCPIMPHHAHYSPSSPSVPHICLLIGPM